MYTVKATESTINTYMSSSTAINLSILFQASKDTIIIYCKTLVTIRFQTKHSTLRRRTNRIFNAYFHFQWHIILAIIKCVSKFRVELHVNRNRDVIQIVSFEKKIGSNFVGSIEFNNDFCQSTFFEELTSHP